jgi:hypothetical protein
MILAFGKDERLIESIRENNLIIIDADISDENDVPKIKLPRAIDETWHFAFTLKYLPKDIDEIYSTNIL